MRSDSGSHFDMDMSMSPSHGTTMSCALADKVPKQRPTGNLAVDNRAQMDRQHLIDCINMLWYYPQIRSDAATFLRAQIELCKAKEVSGPDSFDDLSVFSRIEETWLASFLARELGVEVRALGKAKLQNDRITRELAQALTNIGPAAQVPELCRSKPVMAKTLSERIRRAGDRARVFKAAGGLITASGEVSWLNGVYGLVFDNKGLLTHILHRPSQVKVQFQGEVAVDATWCLLCNYDDMGARIEKGKTVYRMKDQFEKKTGPHADLPWTGKAPKFADLAGEMDKVVVRPWKLALGCPRLSCVSNPNSGNLELESVPQSHVPF